MYTIKLTIFHFEMFSHDASEYDMFQCCGRISHMLRFHLQLSIVLYMEFLIYL